MSEKFSCLSVINTNARSLCPKIDSLLDCITETESAISIVTETWMKDGKELEQLTQDLSLGAGVGMCNRNRQPNDRVFAHGGVAILWKENTCRLQEIKLKVPNAAAYEVLTTTGALHGHTRKLVVLGCYIPPNYTKRKGQKLCP